MANMSSSSTHFSVNNPSSFFSVLNETPLCVYTFSLCWWTPRLILRSASVHCIVITQFPMDVFSKWVLRVARWQQERKTQDEGSKHNEFPSPPAHALLSPSLSLHLPSPSPKPCLHLPSTHFSLNPEGDGEYLLKTIQFCVSPPHKRSDANSMLPACGAHISHLLSFSQVQPRLCSLL